MGHLIYFSIAADALVTEMFMSFIFYGPFYSCVYYYNK